MTTINNFHGVNPAVRDAKMDVSETTTVERKILNDAGDTINGERQDQYGNAEDSFEGIATYWRNHIKMKYGIDVPLTNTDAAIMMTLFKLAREANAPKRDNRLDAIGYMALIERML